MASFLSHIRNWTTAEAGGGGHADTWQATGTACEPWFAQVKGLPDPIEAPVVLPAAAGHSDASLRRVK